MLACERIYDAASPGLLALQSELLATLRVHANGRVAVMRLSRDMLARHDVEAIDTQEFADLPRSVRGVRVGVLLREMEDGRVKVSLRSRSGVNIEPVARRFGGGGHKQAAGCEIEGDLSLAEERVVGELKACLACHAEGCG